MYVLPQRLLYLSFNNNTNSFTSKPNFTKNLATLFSRIYYILWLWNWGPWVTLSLWITSYIVMSSSEKLTLHARCLMKCVNQISFSGWNAWTKYHFLDFNYLWVNLKMLFLCSRRCVKIDLCLLMSKCLLVYLKPIWLWLNQELGNASMPVLRFLSLEAILWCVLLGFRW